MAYLGMCTMDMVEYVNPLTGETTYGSSSCPPEGFVQVKQQTSLPIEVDNKREGFPVVKTEVQMTPQQIEAQVKQAPAQGGGLALAAIVAYLMLGA